MQFTSPEYIVKMVPSVLIKFLILMSIVAHIESGTIPSHPDYIRVVLAKTKATVAILKKSSVVEEGFPVWNTPDNKYVYSSLSNIY